MLPGILGSMSAAPPNVPLAGPAAFRAAASLVVLRPSGDGRGPEVALGHRARSSRFLGNFWAFPGGACEAGEEPADAAVRETLEEVGLAVPRAALVQAGRWRTPPFGPLRYDAATYLAAVPAGTPLAVASPEHDAVEWLRPADALARWAADEALLAPPTRVTLEALATALSEEPAARGDLDLARIAGVVAAASPPNGEFLEGIDFRPGIRIVPVRTPTLPPASHTNCFIVGAGAELVVIDPASPYPEERARLDGVIDGLCAGGRRRVREVLLTHHHPDHVGGAEHLARRLGVKIAAHARTAARLEGKVPVDRLVDDGEVWDLPGDAPGARPRRLVAHLTEGHADGHLVFFEAFTRGAIVGDMLAGTGTIVIDPPEGDMANYLASLGKVKALEADVLYPAHGPPLGDPAGAVDAYVAHRLDREAKVLAAVRQGAGPVELLVPRAYPEVEPRIYPLAARSLLAHLQKLEREGRVVLDGAAWRAS